MQLQSSLKAGAAVQVRARPANREAPVACRPESKKLVCDTLMLAARMQASPYKAGAGVTHWAEPLQLKRSPFTIRLYLNRSF